MTLAFIFLYRSLFPRPDRNPRRILFWLGVLGSWVGFGAATMTLLPQEFRWHLLPEWLVALEFILCGPAWIAHKIAEAMDDAVRYPQRRDRWSIFLRNKQAICLEWIHQINTRYQQFIEPTGSEIPPERKH